MPTALVRSLKAFKPQQCNFLQSYKAGIHHAITLWPVWCQKFAAPRVEQQYTAPETEVGFRLDNFSLSPPPPPPNGKQVTTYFFSLEDRFIPPTEYLSLLTMEERTSKVSSEENPKKGAGETGKLQKEQERNRVKEQEMEDKIGPWPDKPLAGDCCGQGCEVCVWDTYWEELDIYKKLRKAAEEDSGK